MDAKSDTKICHCTLFKGRTVLEEEHKTVGQRSEFESFSSAFSNLLHLHWRILLWVWMNEALFLHFYVLQCFAHFWMLSVYLSRQIGFGWRVWYLHRVWRVKSAGIFLVSLIRFVHCVRSVFVAFFAVYFYRACNAFAGVKGAFIHWSYKFVLYMYFLDYLPSSNTVIYWKFIWMYLYDILCICIRPHPSIFVL